MVYFDGLMKNEVAVQNPQDRHQALRVVEADMDQTVTLASLKGRPLEEIIQRVIDEQSSVTVLLPDGRAVIIEPKQCLQPLPVLEGHVPMGWKDAIYARD